MVFVIHWHESAMDLHVFPILIFLKWSEVAQSCPTLCDPMDCSLPSFSVHGIFQARILAWVAISFSRRFSQPRDWTPVSCIVGRCFTVWATRGSQNVCSARFVALCSPKGPTRALFSYEEWSRGEHLWNHKTSDDLKTLLSSSDFIQPGSSVHGILQARENWSRLPFPSPGDLPDQGTEPRPRRRQILYQLSYS